MNTAISETHTAVRRKVGIVEIIKRHKHVYLLILPAFITVLVFSYLPFLGIVIAFKDFDIIKGLSRSPWVGLDNFIAILKYPKFLKAIGNTLIYGSVMLFGGFGFPILLALLFNELKNVMFKKVVQTISYMPYFLSWISVVGLFYSFFSIDGTFNDIMQTILGEGYKRVNILMDAKQFLPLLFVSHLWKNIGWSSVVFLAAIAGIDPTLYEAATVDGCSKFKQVFYITLPSITITIVVILIMSTGSLVSSNFEQVFGFQNVYTQEQTEVINTLIYRQGIMNGQYSLATAFGLMQGLVTLLIVSISNFIAKKTMDIGAW